MAEKKKQHFVPQFYLRNFSVDKDQKRISLYVIDTDNPVHGVPIKDQTYENYLYGKGGVEDDLSRLEDKTSPIISSAITDNTLPAWQSEGHRVLLTFVLFQDARTPAAKAEMNELAEKVMKSVAKNVLDLKPEVDNKVVNDRDAPVRALQIASEILGFATDLRWKLLDNKTKRLFITSDNPTVRYNQFLEKRNTKAGNIGLGCRGLQIFLPLGPRHMLMLYDGDVYRVGGRKHLESHIEVQEADVAALNGLSAANADEVLYFSADTDAMHVREAVNRAKAHRQTQKVSLTEHMGIAPDGRSGVLIQSSAVDLRIGLALDCSVILPRAAGTPLSSHLVQLRNPELVRQFEMSRMRLGPYDPRKVLESFLRH